MDGCSCLLIWNLIFFVYYLEHEHHAARGAQRESGREAGERDFTGSVSVRLIPCRAGPLSISGCSSLGKWGVPAAGTAWNNPQSACTCQVFTLSRDNFAPAIAHPFAIFPCKKNLRTLTNTCMACGLLNRSAYSKRGNAGRYPLCPPLLERLVRNSPPRVRYRSSCCHPLTPPQDTRGFFRGDPRALSRSGRGPGFPTPPPRNPGGTCGGTTGSNAVPHAEKRTRTTTVVSMVVSTALVCAGGDRAGWQTWHTWGTAAELLV